MAAAAAAVRTVFKLDTAPARWHSGGWELLDKSRSPVCIADSRTCSGIFKTTIHAASRTIVNENLRVLPVRASASPRFSS